MAIHERDGAGVLFKRPALSRVGQHRASIRSSFQRLIELRQDHDRHVRLPGKSLERACDLDRSPRNGRTWPSQGYLERFNNTNGGRCFACLPDTLWTRLLGTDVHQYKATRDRPDGGALLYEIRHVDLHESVGAGTGFGVFEWGILPLPPTPLFDTVDEALAFAKQHFPGHGVGRHPGADPIPQTPGIRRLLAQGAALGAGTDGMASAARVEPIDRAVPE